MASDEAGHMEAPMAMVRLGGILAKANKRLEICIIHEYHKSFGRANVYSFHGTCIDNMAQYPLEGLGTEVRGVEWCSRI